MAAFDNSLAAGVVLRSEVRFRGEIASRHLNNINNLGSTRSAPTNNEPTIESP